MDYAKASLVSCETLQAPLPQPFVPQPGIDLIPVDFMIQVRNYQAFYALFSLVSTQTANSGQNTVLFPAIKTNKPEIFQKYVPATGKITLNKPGLYRFSFWTALNVAGYVYDVSVYNSTGASIIAKQDWVAAANPLNSCVSGVYLKTTATPEDIVFRLNNGDASSHTINSATAFIEKLA